MTPQGIALRNSQGRLELPFPLALKTMFPLKLFSVPPFLEKFQGDRHFYET